jgi:hypothetical protein
MLTVSDSALRAEIRMKVLAATLALCLAAPATAEARQGRAAMPASAPREEDVRMVAPALEK